MAWFIENIKKYKLVGFCNADYVGDKLKKKSTNESCQFLGDNLISWSNKKQSTIALSTIETEYIVASGCTTHILWMKSQLEDYQLYESNILILYDNAFTICLSKNPILYPKAKHIEIKHRFIRDYVQKGVINLKFIDIDHQLSDIFTKLITEDVFVFILKKFKMKLCPE